MKGQAAAAFRPVAPFSLLTWRGGGLDRGQTEKRKKEMSGGREKTKFSAQLSSLLRHTRSAFGDKMFPSRISSEACGGGRFLMLLFGPFSGVNPSSGWQDTGPGSQIPLRGAWNVREGSPSLLASGSVTWFGHGADWIPPFPQGTPKSAPSPLLFA